MTWHLYVHDTSAAGTVSRRYDVEGPKPAIGEEFIMAPYLDNNRRFRLRVTRREDGKTQMIGNAVRPDGRTRLFCIRTPAEVHAEVVEVVG